MSAVLANSLVVATNDAMHNEETKRNVYAFVEVYSHLSEEDFLKALYLFSAELVATTADLVTQVFMTESEIEGMLTEVSEMMRISKSIEEEFPATE